MLEEVPDVVEVGGEHEVPGVLGLDLHGHQTGGVSGHVAQRDPVEQLGFVAGDGLPVEVAGKVGTDVVFGGDGVLVLLDFLLVGVDRDVVAGEVLQAAGVV